MMKKTFTKLFVAFLALLLAPNWAVAEDYSLYVQNKGASATDIIQVSSDNAANILAGDAINDGKLIYNASTKTLTIKAGVDIQRINNFSIGDQAGVADLTIYVEGNAEVNHIYTCSNTTITGPGKLTMTDPVSGNTGSYAIELGPTQPVLTIKDADVEITYPIPTEGAIKNKKWQYPGTLVINNSNVTISTTYQETSQTGRVIQLESEPTLINCAITSPESVTWGEDNDEYLCYLNNNSPVGEIVITATGGGSVSLGSFSYQTTSTGGLQYVSNSYTPAFFNMEILSEPNGNEPGTVRISGPGKPSGNTQYLTDYAINNGYTGSVKLEKEIVHDSKTYKVVEIESLQGFTQITSITIPSTITTISATAFDGCTGLQDITIEGSKPTIIGTEANLFSGIADNPVLTIPKWDTTWDAIYAAKAWGAPTWSSIAYIAPKGTPGAVIWMDDNGDIVEPQNSTNHVEVRINAYADYTAEIISLKADIPDAKSKFTIPTSLTIEGLAWADGTYEIKQVNAGALSNSNYTNDAIIEELVIPSGIKIEDGAFTNLSGLKKVTFEDGCVKSDYGNIFSNITSSASLEADPQSPVILICPNTWEDVANNWAGGNWRVLANDEFIETMTVTRHSNSNTTTVHLIYKIIDADNKKVSLAKVMDALATSYTDYEMTIPNTVNTDYTVTQIGTEAFKDINWLYSITMPSGLTAIEDNAFVNLTNLDYISFSNVTAEQSDYGDVFSKITSGSSLEADPLPPVLLYCPDTWENVGSDWAGGNWRVMANDEFYEDVTIDSHGTVLWTKPTLRLLYKIIDADNKKVSLVGIQSAPTTYTDYQMTIPNTVNTDYTVTQIGTEAFKDIDWLYSITMPSGLTAIEDNAFVNMDNLFNVDFTNVTAALNTFDWSEDDVKFSNIRYSETQKTYLTRATSWGDNKPYDDWGGGTVSIWGGGGVTSVTRYGVFINGTEITTKLALDDILGDGGSITYDDTQGWGANRSAKLTITGNDVQLSSITNNYTNAHVESGYERKKLVIYVAEDSHLTLSSDTDTPLVCNFNTEIGGKGDITIATSAAGKPTIAVADDCSFIINKKTNEGETTINNTGSAACVSLGTGSTVSLHGSIDMTTNGTAVAPDVTDESLGNSFIASGGFDGTQVSIRNYLEAMDEFTINHECKDEKVLSLKFMVVGSNQNVKLEKIENPNNASEVELVIPSTVVGPDGREYNVQIIGTGAYKGDLDADEITNELTLVPASFIKSIVIPASVESIDEDAIWMVTNLQSVEFKMSHADVDINEAAFEIITSGGNDQITSEVPYELVADAPAVTLIFPEGTPAVKPDWCGGNWAGGFVDENAIMPGDEITDQRLEITAEKEGDVPGSLAVNYVITKVPSESVHGEVMIWMPDEGNNYAGTDYLGEGLNAVSDPRDANNEEDESIIGTLSIPSTITVGEGEDAKIYDVTEIGANAFSSWQDLGYNCPWINNVILPETIKEIYGFAFDSNETLTSVTFKGARVDELGVYMIFSSIAAALTVPASWGLVADDWEDGTWTSINYVKEVELDENGNEVETTPVNFAVDDPDEQTMSVSGSEELTEKGTVVIPATVTLGTDDFTVTAIGDGAFEGQTNLTGATLPKTVTSIGENAFAGCTNMTSLTVQSPFAPTVGEGAFTGTSANLTVNYPAAAYAIYNEAGWTGVAIFQPTVMQPNEWSTICSTQDFTLPEGIEAYIVAGIDYTSNKVLVKKVDGIKANVPLMIHKTGTDEDYPVTVGNIAISEEGTQLPTTAGDADAFVGFAPAVATETLSIPEGSGTGTKQAYILINGTFVKWTEGNLAPYRCFLWATQAFYTGAAPQMGIEIVDGETTGVGDVRGKKDDVRGEWYDLSGRKLQGKPTQKGVYIINGKKVNVK